MEKSKMTNWVEAIVEMYKRSHYWVFARDTKEIRRIASRLTIPQLCFLGNIGALLQRIARNEITRRRKEREL